MLFNWMETTLLRLWLVRLQLFPWFLVFKKASNDGILNWSNQLFDKIIFNQWTNYPMICIQSIIMIQNRWDEIRRIIYIISSPLLQLSPRSKMQGHCQLYLEYFCYVDVFYRLKRSWRFRLPFFHLYCFFSFWVNITY